MKYEKDGKLYHLAIQTGDIGKYVIMPGDPKRCEKIAAYLKDARCIADHREYVTYTGFLEGEKVSVISTGIGGPSAAIAMEEAVKAGGHTFLRVGTSGGMQREVLSGDLVIATAAIREEGTSASCAPISFPAVASFEIVQSLCESAKAQEFSYHVGVVHCKDNFYMQHESERMPIRYEFEPRWRSFIELGTLASEMESSTLFVFGSHLHVRVGAVLLVVANQERERLKLENPIVSDTDRAVRCAIEAMRIQIRKDRL